jgi:prepilin-type N-terminal cleavage/methylation domain-containing protein
MLPKLQIHELNLENSMQLKKQSGFTLVEIAIVLVIVGLLIGGVLKGQEMITNAKLKRIESDNAGLQAAMFSYQDRYLQLPGDDDAANTRFDAAPTEGNGDGVILGHWSAPVAATPDETGYFWTHLRASGLVNGDPADIQPQQNAYGGKIGIHYGGLGIAGHVTVFGQLEGGVAKILESRLDDSNGTTGRIRGAPASVTADMPTVVTTAVAAYLDTTLYDLVFRF